MTDKRSMDLYKKHCFATEKPCVTAIHDSNEIFSPKGNLLRILLISHLGVLLAMFLSGDRQSNAASLVATSFACFLGVIGMSFFYLRKTLGMSVCKIAIAAFSIRLIGGVIHYLLFVQKDYFSANATYQYSLIDYVWMHESLIFVKDSWEAGLFFHLPETFFIENKNAFMHIYNAVLYYLNGVYSLNIAPWNSLHTIYTACLVTGLAIYQGANARQATLAFIVVAFEPFGFFSSLMWRDSVGQTFLALAIYLLITTQKNLWQWFLVLPAACILAYCQRQPYLYVVIACALYIYLGRMTVRPAKTLISSVILFAGLIWLANQDFVLSLFTRASVYTEHRAESVDLMQRMITLPLRILRAVVGPFPWYQIFLNNKNLYTEYMVPEFFQSVLNITIGIITLPYIFRSLKERKFIDSSLFFGICLFFLAAVAEGVHSSYVSTGAVFFLPVACRVPSSKWVRTGCVVLLIYLLANFLYWALGLTGAGVIMNVTGY